jgi:signal transduction histidine kinase
MRSLETIERNASVQAKLISDLLDISRITAGKLGLNLQPVELRSLIETVISSLRQLTDAKKLNIIWWEEVPENVLVSGDRDRLQQVISNLLTNAIKFTPELGSISVKLSVIESQAEISVTDTGIGISPEFLPHVFDRFRQDQSYSSGGLGLGLAIARYLVDLHKGTIHAESLGEGQGATFKVRLPLLNNECDIPR